MKHIITILILFAVNIAAAQPVLKSFRTIVYGDSFTYGFGSDNDRTYPHALDSLLGIGTVNYAQSGETSSQILTRFNTHSTDWVYPTIIWSGRNNYTSPTQVKIDIAAMIASLGHTNYIVLSVMNGDYANEYDGQTDYNTLTTLNSDLATLYGARFLDVRAYIVSQYDAGNAQDVIDFGNDVPPSSLRYDELHLNSEGYKKVAQYIVANASDYILVNKTVGVTASQVSNLFRYGPTLGGLKGANIYANRLEIKAPGALYFNQAGNYCSIYPNVNSLYSTAQDFYYTLDHSSVRTGTSASSNFGIRTNATDRFVIDSLGNEKFRQSAQSNPGIYQDIVQANHTGGVPIGIKYTGGTLTGIAANTPINDVYFALSSKTCSTGTIPRQFGWRIIGGTTAFLGASTITDDYTLEVVAPLVGANGTQTRAWAARFGGNVTVTSGLIVGDTSAPQAQIHAKAASAGTVHTIIENTNSAGTAQLNVKNNLGSTFGLRINGSTATNAQQTILSNSAGATIRIEAGGVQLMRLLASGNVAIGTNTAPHSTLQVGGSLALPYVAKTGGYTMTASDYLVECTANTFTVTLPTAASIEGRIYAVKNTGAGTITVGTTSSQTIDGVTTKTLLTNEYVEVMSNGANWIIK